MADNTTLNTGAGGDVIASDDVTTMNGAASSGVKVQRVKVGYGTDGTHRDVDNSNPLPTKDMESRSGITFKGRCITPRTPGRAGTAGQKIWAMFNADATVIVDVERIMVDYYATAAKVVAPPTLKLIRITAAPTNGTSMNANKTPFDTTLSTSSSNVTIYADASADGTGSATTLTHATANGVLANVLSSVYAPRNLTLVGYEMWDRFEFMDDQATNVTLRQNQGLLLFLDYNTATFNPVTDMYSVVVEWTEYTGKN